MPDGGDLDPGPPRRRHPGHRHAGEHRDRDQRGLHALPDDGHRLPVRRGRRDEDQVHARGVQSSSPSCADACRNFASPERRSTRSRPRSMRSPPISPRSSPPSSSPWRRSARRREGKSEDQTQTTKTPKNRPRRRPPPRLRRRPRHPLRRLPRPRRPARRPRPRRRRPPLRRRHPPDEPRPRPRPLRPRRPHEHAALSTFPPALRHFRSGPVCSPAAAVRTRPCNRPPTGSPTSAAVSSTSRCA